MVWKVSLEVLLLAVILLAGAPFWACFKAPRHLHEVLSDARELRVLVDHIGYNTLRADAQDVKTPPYGTFGDNIQTWDAAHYKSLSQTRNLLFVVVLAAFTAAWWLGPPYLALALLVFLLLGLAGVPASAKNNNANHLLIVIRNLIAWNLEDEDACQDFCCRKNPEYWDLFAVLNSVANGQE